MKFTWSKHCFQFKTPSGTSRGVLHDKDSWLLQMTIDGKTGIGECSIIEGLSPESPEIVEDILEERFLVTYGDGLANVNINKLIDFLND